MRQILPPHAGDHTSPNPTVGRTASGRRERPHDGRRCGIDARDRAVAEIRDPDEAVGATVPSTGWVPTRTVAVTAPVTGSIRERFRPGRSRPRARSRRRPRTRPGSYGRSARESRRSWRGRSGRRCRPRSSRPRPCLQRRSVRPGPSGTGIVAVTRFVAGFTRETVLSELFVTQTDSAAKRTS